METHDPSGPRQCFLAHCVRHFLRSFGEANPVLTKYTYSNLAATMFAPGSAALAKEFHITSSTVVSLTVSIYLFGFAVGPMFIAPVSELYGRLVIYHTCNVIYIGFIIGCALGKSTGMFLVFRFLAGCASSGPLTVGGGTVADVVPPAQRGRAMSLFFMGPLLGPVGDITSHKAS
jgi:MFS family permease